MEKNGKMERKWSYSNKKGCLSGRKEYQSAESEPHIVDFRPYTKEFPFISCLYSIMLFQHIGIVKIFGVG